MRKNKILIFITVLSAIAMSIAFGSGAFKSLEKAMDKESHKVEGTAAHFFTKSSLVLAQAESKIDCRKSQDVRNSVGDELNRYWQDSEDEDVLTFIHFDFNSRVLTVCHKGKKVAARIPANPNVTDIELVRVSEAQFGDMNGDGKNEFLVFQGQCAEGPCLGGYSLFQIDGEKIKELYTLHAETVEQANEFGRNGLRLEKDCYTHEFGMGPVYFSVVEFTKDGELKTVPYSELRTKFPLAVEQMKPSHDLGIVEESSPQQQAYLKIHDLIVQAYHGKPRAELFKAHDQILAELTPVEDETAPAERLGLYCETKEILELISGP